MREMIRMFVVISLLSAFSGGVLAMVRVATREDIEKQQLKYTKAPAIQTVFANATNDPLQDRFKILVGEKEESFFVGKIDNDSNNVVFESFSRGYGGAIGLMVAIHTPDDKIVGIAVTTHSETPGLGSRAKTDVKFTKQFQNLSIRSKFAVKKDGGNIDALSGATVTSRGVCNAINLASEVYTSKKSEIESEIQKIKK